MTCHNCHADMVKAGLHRHGVQRWKCHQCGKRFQERRQKPFGEDVRLPKETVIQILHCLVEGNSVRGAARLCDVEKRTVLNILKLAGENCERLLTEKLHGVSTGGQIQCDEIWTFVKVKQGHLQPHHDTEKAGDAYTFIALDRTTKLVLAWHLGKRDRISTEDFISKVRWATAEGETFDICTDGFEAYTGAIDAGLSDRANYAMVIKNYSKPEEGRERYSPGQFVSVDKKAIIGEPDMGRASTLLAITRKRIFLNFRRQDLAEGV
jgi:transposase-like protein/IS1 family transposase